MTVITPSFQQGPNSLVKTRAGLVVTEEGQAVAA